MSSFVSPMAMTLSIVRMLQSALDGRLSEASKVLPASTGADTQSVKVSDVKRFRGSGVLLSLIFIADGKEAGTSKVTIKQLPRGRGVTVDEAAKDVYEWIVGVRQTLATLGAPQPAAPSQGDPRDLVSYLKPKGALVYAQTAAEVKTLSDAMLDIGWRVRCASAADEQTVQIEGEGALGWMNAAKAEALHALRRGHQVAVMRLQDLFASPLEAMRALEEHADTLFVYNLHHCAAQLEDSQLKTLHVGGSILRGSSAVQTLCGLLLSMERSTRTLEDNHPRRGGRAPYGKRWVEGVLETHPEESRVLVLIKGLAQQGLTRAEIAAHLNAEGYTRRGGGAWNARAVETAQIARKRRARRRAER